MCAANAEIAVSKTTSAGTTMSGGPAQPDVPSVAVRTVLDSRLQPNGSPRRFLRNALRLSAIKKPRFDVNGTVADPRSSHSRRGRWRTPAFWHSSGQQPTQVAVLGAAGHDRRWRGTPSVVGHFSQWWRDTAAKDLPASFHERKSDKQILNAIADSASSRADGEPHRPPADRR
jgi:hypothetical protein